MDTFSLSRNFWNFAFENPELISPGHSAIFFFAIEHCNRLGWKEKFGFPSQMVMEAIGIKNWRTYQKYLQDLVDWGFIKMIEKSKNQYSSNIIAIVKNTKAPTKALDKALSKHSTKHSQSTVSINIQDNNITNNNISKDIETKVSNEITTYGNSDINIIIESLKNCNMGILDDTIKKQRQYGKLIKGKLDDIKGFNGDYGGFITKIYDLSNEYQKQYFKSAEKFYYNIAGIVAGIKTQIETKKPQIGRC